MRHHFRLSPRFLAVVVAFAGVATTLSAVEGIWSLFKTDPLVPVTYDAAAVIFPNWPEILALLFWAMLSAVLVGLTICIFRNTRTVEKLTVYESDPTIVIDPPGQTTVPPKEQIHISSPSTQSIDVLVRIGDGARIRIASASGVEPQPRPWLRSVPCEEHDVSSHSGVGLAPFIVERMEIRVESVFRPRTPDVEVMYVLTGVAGTRPDRLHGLPSAAVIADATAYSVTSNVSKMIELIAREQSDEIKLIVEVHTHPAGIASPSDADRSVWKSTASVLGGAFPHALILFGIHSVSNETSEFLQRVAPRKEASSRIRWRSNTRDHEFALFSPSAEPHEITLTG